jgi:phosphoenolpyruvate synthase/pyruvate phosphate dikinase
VTVQSMVFGNMGDTSGTGVCFTRNPSTGVGLDVALHTRYVCMPDLSGLYLA